MSKIKKNIKKFFKFFEKHSLAVLLVIATICALLIDRWSYVNKYITLYTDARSHLSIARSLIDNVTPGITQLGGVWLPLYHILELPFVMNNFLYYTGLAGTIVSSIFYLLSNLYLFKLIYRFTKNNLIALFGTLLYTLNINILYLQSTSMTEITALFFLIASIYYFLIWQSTKKLSDLLLLAFITCLGTFARYENWAMAIGVFLGITVSIIKNNISKNFKELESSLIIYAYCGFFGIFVWLLYNLLIFHDILYFQHSPFSAEAYQIDFVKEGLDKPYHNILYALKFYFFDVIENSSWIMVILGFIGFIYTFIKRHSASFLGLFIVTFCVFLFEVYSLYTANSLIRLPDIYPYGYYNIRYGIYSFPFFILFCSSLLLVKNKLLKILFILLMCFSIIYPLYTFNPITLQEPKSLYYYKNGFPAYISYMQKSYKGGKILASFSANGDAIYYIHIDIKDYITEGNRTYWTNALKNPQDYVSWIIMSQNEADIRNLLTKAIIKSPKLKKYFILVYDKDGVYIYKRNILKSNE